MRKQQPISKRLRGAALLVAAVGLGPFRAGAHEVPNDVTILSFVAPEAGVVRIVMRVPLEAMVDIEFPVFGPGYLDIENAEKTLRDAANTWITHELEVYENGNRVTGIELTATRISIPSDRSFREYDSALAHVRSAGLQSSIELVWQQAMLDLIYEAPILSEESRFAVRLGLERLGLRVVSVLRFVPPDGVERVYQLVGDEGIIELDPRWHQAAGRFVVSGFLHILEGFDHLLFVLCLVIPFRQNVRALVWIVTAFTVAHSITLAAAALGFAPTGLWFPPLIEALIAASIFYNAVENVFGPTLQRRWTIAFGFGLVHGFGFAFALRETLQFAGDHVPMALFAFNVGVELGQMLVLLAYIATLGVVFRFVKQERVALIVLSVLIGHTAWHWMLDRFAVLREFQV
jgi:hypothetical protein